MKFDSAWNVLTNVIYIFPNNGPAYVLITYNGIGHGPHNFKRREKMTIITKCFTFKLRMILRI